MVIRDYHDGLGDEAMEMHQVRYFLTVCETKNFTRAAELCHVSQPALTTAIKKLEEELGGALFYRERGRVIETGLGGLVRPRLELLWREAGAALADADSYHRLHKVPLRLGIMVTIGPVQLSGLLAKYQTDNPDVEVEVHEGTLDELTARLNAGNLDLAILNNPGDLDPKLHADALYQERYIVLFPTGHRFEAMEEIRLADLSGERYLDRLACEMRDLVMAACSQRKVELYAAFRSEREDWIQGMVMAGMGFAFMPEHSVTVDGIPSRPLVDPVVERTVSLISVVGQRFSPAAEVFARTARSHKWPD